jgi:hypothetical protein|uniref:Uncharacterized protein n=1 Tax=Mantoniella tinhauana virus 1 TaxID=3111543 RepID=A0AB38ZLZ0_9VIRU
MEQLMSLIDANSEHIPEGEYLKMCEAMKEVYEKVKLVNNWAPLRSMDYYEIEEELTNVTMELERLHRERDSIHYRTKLSKAMKRDAIAEYAFTEGFHSLREYTPEALQEAGIRVNLNDVYKKFLDAYNDDIFQRKKAIQMMVQQTRDHRDNLVREMVDVM